MIDARPARTTEQVIARMESIESALPTRDGVAWFNKMYLQTTRSVLLALEEGVFADAGFIEQLDIHFANLYFSAVYYDSHNRERVPRAWAPLFNVRKARNIAPMQFAVAGMNAHINRDLPIALLKTLSKQNLKPDRKRQADFTKLDLILEQTQREVKKWFATGFVGVIDQVFGKLDDVLANWSISRAREAAWIQTQTLWALRAFPSITSVHLLNLDRMVGFAGRGLLVPTAS